MQHALPFVPYPYITLPGESLRHEPTLYAAPNRLICTGDVTFKADFAPLVRVLSEKFQEEWPPAVAEEMARLVIQQAKVNPLGPELYVSASALPAFAMAHLELAYCGRYPLTGSEATYGWPSGKITRIKQVLYGYLFEQDICVLYVRLEEASLPGKVHHQLQFPIGTSRTSQV